MESPVRYCRVWRSWLACIVVAASLVTDFAATAQEAAESPPAARTTVDSTIPVDHLHVILRPLTKDELTIELEGWLGLLRAKITEVGGVD